MKDLLILAVANYLPEKIKIYIESLNKCGFDGDKIIICYNLPTETINYLKLNGWECYGMELQGFPHMKRLIDIWWFLQNDSRNWRYVITTDIRDIVWQSNPSEWLYDNLKSEIIIASECIKNKDEPWAYKNLNEGYGTIFWDSIKENTVANVGVIAGKYEYMKDLLKLIWLASQAGNTAHYTDQSALNLILNNKLLEGKIDLNPNFGIQLASLQNPSRYEHKNLKVESGFVINEHTNLPYVLVHQYDRIPWLNDIIENQYK